MEEFTKSCLYAAGIAIVTTVILAMFDPIYWYEPPHARTAFQASISEIVLNIGWVYGIHRFRMWMKGNWG